MDTGTGKRRASPTRTSEGPMGLSRAFLGAGAPVVVATLWPVADRPSGRLFASFYRHLFEGGSPGEALRAAQVEALGSGAALPARDWASLVVMGDARRSLQPLSTSTSS